MDKIKAKLKEIRSLSNKLTRSDLQGIVMAEAIKFNPENREEIEEIFLRYCDKKLLLGRAHKALIKMI